MKKTGIALLLLSFLFTIVPVCAEESAFEVNAPAAILIDYQSGTILYKKNSEEKFYPASMTKMMSLLLVIEQLNSGLLKWEDEVIASAHAASLGGSQIYLEAGEIMTVKDLVKSSALASANDAITALAEKVGGTEEHFVSMMNQKAEELGCINTHFVNPTGLHDEQHYSCAQDMALIAKTLIQEGQQDILQYTSRYEDYIRENTEKRFWLVNTNKLIRTYSGMDGLKTGYTSQSLYCITVTACRDNQRLIAVVMNEPTKDQRTKDVQSLLDYGFAFFKRVVDVEENTVITEISIEKGKPEKIKLSTADSISHLEKKGNEVSVLDKSYIIDKLHAPIEKGEIIGKLIYYYSDGSQSSSNLKAEGKVEELNFWDICCLFLRKTVIC